MIRILDAFSVISGVSLNYEKSSIIKWSKRVNPIVSNLCKRLGCKFQRHYLPWDYHWELTLGGRALGNLL